MSETCPERIYSNDYMDVAGHICGRALKDDGLCGIHLAAKHRRAAKQDAWNAKWADERKLLAELAARLKALGIAGVPHVNNKGATGKVVVGIADLEALVSGRDHP